jgi:Nucleotide modification associated domain 2
MNVWTYVITFDAGAAPNFDPPSTTLVICKPRIRKSAQCGDLILAFNGQRLLPHEPHSVRWAGVVNEVLSIGEYWRDPRFQSKKPGHSATPDNIYRPARGGGLRQVSNTTHGRESYVRDVSGLNALVLHPTWYFGFTLAILPESFNLRMVGGRRGHRCFQIDDASWRVLEVWLDRNVPASLP